MYEDGTATSWLHRVIVQLDASGAVSCRGGMPRVWLSKPVQTMSVPTLVTGNSNSGFNPASVLLLLAGTGVVALPQILQHRDPQRKLGISTSKTQQLHVPIDMILSCRTDDVLMLPEITQLCQEAYGDTAPGAKKAKAKASGLRRCTLLLTGPGAETHPFPDVNSCEAELVRLHSLPNAQVLQTRLTLELVSEALSRMAKPCRVVVSGPQGFNTAAKGMLLTANVAEGAITVLEA